HLGHQQQHPPGVRVTWNTMGRGGRHDLDHASVRQASVHCGHYPGPIVRLYGSLAMSLDPALRTRIETLLTTNRVVLFMKGEPAAPQCGFSAKAVGLLGSTGVPYQHVDVLSDPEIREGI